VKRQEKQGPGTRTGDGPEAQVEGKATRTLTEAPPWTVPEASGEPHPS
jgi:hypothetical protein